MKQPLLWTAVALSMVFWVHSKGIAQYELEDGSCSEAVIGDLVLLQYSSRRSIPVQERQSKVVWYGDETLYCVLVLSKQKSHRNSTVEVLKGGVNHTFVELRLHSELGFGFQYWVRGFGKKVHPL
ncbi:unnamed protein product [Acanthoscelides obtectus]|uniref:Secreted protein n=1 Tax=Acanthoscelides obtectus TaxID=200917 RepID=A0A9P0LK00_ACAOB|nr:unnamed protein product [Acanthoscelides obtectus]CAK1655195.1 hypothetical protein AOBTE_LOCUS19074 [Acanthoscelides obtectus]